MPNEIFYADSSITLDESNPAEDWSGSVYLISGAHTFSPPSIYRSLLHFDINALPTTAEIQKCILNMYVIGAIDPDITDFFTPYLVDNSWTLAVKWATQPTTNFNFRGSNEAITNVGYISFDVTDIVKEWIALGINNGLILRSTETISNSYKVFISSNYADYKSLQPFLSIQYDNPSLTKLFNRRFETIVDTLLTTSSEQTSVLIDVSQIFDYTVFIQNTGANQIDFTLEISPDGTNFTTDFQLSIPVGQLIPIVPKYLTNYIRFKYISSGGASSFNYWVLKQS